MHRTIPAVRPASFLTVLLAALLGACSYVPRIPGVTPYRIEIQQGNLLTQDAVSQLKSGMTKEQVRFALGTPLLTDIFHADRWDYVFWREQADGKREQRKLAVFFENGKLVRVSGDVVARQELGKQEADKQEAK